MASFASENALLLIDFINDIVDPKGKVSGKGYADFDARRWLLALKIYRSESAKRTQNWRAVTRP